MNGGLTSLRLENFRSFDTRELSFGPTTVIIGNNGVGKTSVLEAIAMLSMTTSWRTEKDSEVVRWGTDFARVSGQDMELVIQASPYLKRMRIDGVSKRTYQVIGQFPTILFQPDDMQLIYGAPAFRRQYIDRVISQTSTVYTKAIIQLQQVLRQRNRLLKNIQEGVAVEAELPFWDQQLSELQEVICVERAAFISHLQEQIPPLFEAMVPSTSTVELHYQTSPHTHEHSFLEHLQRNHYKEIAAGNSLYGPHREDFSVKWGGHLAEQSMSRGQARSLLVAFKIAELGYITARTERKPILLLDDIFSELDAERRRSLFDVFGGYQVIMTTTELDVMKSLKTGELTIIDLK